MFHSLLGRCASHGRKAHAEWVGVSAAAVPIVDGIGEFRRIASGRIAAVRLVFRLECIRIILAHLRNGRIGVSKLAVLEFQTGGFKFLHGCALGKRRCKLDLAEDPFDGMSSCLIIEALLELGSIFVVLRLQFGKLLRQGRIVGQPFFLMSALSLIPRGRPALSGRRARW